MNNPTSLFDDVRALVGNRQISDCPIYFVQGLTALILIGANIDAIKMVRNSLGTGLKESKDIVEAFRKDVIDLHLDYSINAGERLAKLRDRFMAMCVPRLFQVIANLRHENSTLLANYQRVAGHRVE